MSVFIRKVSLGNYRSIAQCEVDLGPVTFLVGANGSGKGNFLDALRSGKDTDLRGDILEGHLSTTLPHLANISYRVGRSLMFHGATEKFVNDRDADAHLSRSYRKPYVVPETV